MYCRRVYFMVPGFEPKAGDKVVDIGSNKGLYAVMAATAGADVLALEGQLGFVRMIEQNAAQNGVADRVQVVHALRGAETGALSTLAPRQESSAWSDDVGSVTMSELLGLSSFDCIDLMKMDIEGSEFSAFETAATWLPSVNRLVMEAHAEWGPPAQIIDQLEAAGFRTTLFNRYSRRVTERDDAVQYVFAAQQMG